ncbi:YaaA family protein [uncultured Sphingomonas sp.]|uniref:YaaA family protein n=1 Tax=uncultured Sphingomonas sp. TaxID=158754 RepID=UPI0035CAF196
MIAVLSPAKSLDFESAPPPHAATVPRFAREAEMLAKSCARLSRKRLAELMRISPALAALNSDRYRDFATAPERAALFAFAGDVYHGLDAHTLDDAALAHAQDRLRVLSGLYGLLRPLDAIRPHRLEMGTRWAPRHARLTDWWGARIAAALGRELEAAGSTTILNLASNEYWAAVAKHLAPSIRIVAVEFREGADAHFISFHAKRARGSMARWVVDHRVEDPAVLPGFDRDGYRFDVQASTPDRLRFVRL